MSEPIPPHRVLHLVIEGLPAAQREALEAQRDSTTEIFALSETTAAAALEKIFTAETVTVWGALPTAK